ncbi:MAG: GNAT family N-acetyltransferase [Candidatus Cloacimonetes bacterium]|nr:GNAT family N-acetyltransferase [Candidatus Cloacimonadota bacterium]
MEKIIIRDYEEQDFGAILRIWQECGWLEDKMDDILKDIIGECRIKVAEIGGSVEASAMATDGRLHYLDETFKINIINAVTVSLVARKSGLAKKTLVQLLKDEAAAGYPLSVLGIFEQGFYDKLGYGSANYYRQMHFDPAEMKVPVNCRIPRRLNKNDFLAVHENRLNRSHLHGHIEMTSVIATKSEIEFHKKGFGLGYYNDEGRLTHHLWIDPQDQESGPYRIIWCAYETNEQFLELLALMQSFNNQVREITLTEPANIQITDFLQKPIHTKTITRGAKFQNYINSNVFWQLRMLDVEKCLRKTHLQIEPFEFNLELNDPIMNFLDKNSKWQGCGGEYFVKLGTECEIVKNFRIGYPVLRAGIGAFSRMWLGVKPASGLAVSDELTAEPELLKKLDRAFCLPEPQPDWWF